MKTNILLGGAAGQGLARTAEIISKIFNKSGYYVFNYRDYQSLIKGGHNFNVISVSDKPVYSHDLEYDIIIALNQETVEKHSPKLKKEGVVFAEKGIEAKNIFSFDLAKLLKEINAPAVYGNNIIIGALFKYFGIPVDIVISVMEEEFKKNNELIEKAVREGYELTKTKINLPKPSKKEKYFLTGNQAISAGAIASGMDIYLAYPITPATPVLHILASKQIENDFIVSQPENEIAVISAALGSSYAGASTMIGTSGAGFSLMAETISCQGMSEVPLVIYLSQRAGPASGVPTYTSQGDLKFALNAGHGEFPKIVVAPGDAKECFYRTMESFYLAEKYRIVVILLGDKHVCESNYNFDEFEEPSVKPKKLLSEPKKDYKSYLITENGVSPRSVPGQGEIVRATSYEHDENGHTTEKEEIIIEMNDKRFRKFEKAKEEILGMVPAYLHGKGKNLIISWGSTKGAILDALGSLDNVRFLQVSYISPFPKEEVKREIESSDKVILIENNATGLLGDIITEQTGKIINKKILKYDARPFTSSDIVEKVKEVLK